MQSSSRRTNTQRESEYFVPVHLSTARPEVDRACAALEAAGIALTVEYIVFESTDRDGTPLPGFRLLTPQGNQQQAIALVNRVLSAREDSPFSRSAGDDGDFLVA